MCDFPRATQFQPLGKSLTLPSAFDTCGSGGCYAKCVNLTEENEPDIFQAIKFQSILENTLYVSAFSSCS